MITEHGGKEGDVLVDCRGVRYIARQHFSVDDAYTLYNKDNSTVYVTDTYKRYCTIINKIPKVVNDLKDFKWLQITDVKRYLW